MCNFGTGGYLYWKILAWVNQWMLLMKLILLVPTGVKFSLNPRSEWWGDAG